MDQAAARLLVTSSESESSGRRRKTRSTKKNVTTAKKGDDQGQDEDQKETTAMKKTDGKGKRCRLVSYGELPEYMKDNEFIMNYYRANWPIKDALLSVFQWHNETLNVWTHLIGFILFVGLTAANFMDVPQMEDFLALFTRHVPTSGEVNISQHPKYFLLGAGSKLIELKQEAALQMSAITSDTDTTKWPFLVFLGGSMFCLLSSSVCHLFSCHSHRLNTVLLSMDYVGIAVMIITSFFPPIYYIFQCSPHWQLAYLAGITLMGVATVVALLSPSLSSRRFRSLRAMLFVSMGLFGLLPATHALVVNWDDPRRDLTLAYEAAMAVSYLTGTVFYVSRVPERWLPGRFDLAGHSHQIFHVLVLAGALAHYGASLVFLQHRGQLSCDL